MHKDAAAKRGFTLIELLIVVAIIAILAAIAIPNFLEAQVRAKVSRAKSDMRAIATAEEAYFVDWNSYTLWEDGDASVGNYCQGAKMLTTPVAYMTSVPFDGFGNYNNPGGYNSAFNNKRNMFEIGTGSADNKEPSGIRTPSNFANQMPRPNPMGLPADTLMIRSVGPDRYDGTPLHTYPYKDGYSWQQDFPAETVIWSNDAVGVRAALGLIYDPTNGTVSAGDIFRLGGVKPIGPQWDAFFANASK